MSSTEDEEDSSSDENFSFQTKYGKQYSPTVWKLYYTLLVSEIPASKITSIIKAVIKSFNPSVDVEHLKLPQRACASYMRRDELKTVSNAHKATVFCQQASENMGFKLKTDGTTKRQKKLEGVAINDIVVSVNEVPDGTAQSAIASISRELEYLRKTAHALKMPNADGINWILFVSSTSDSAASQKRLNKLIENCREADETTYGQTMSTTVELIETFCSMHLAVNLRKAFQNSTADGKHNPVDTLVYEFCKLFGKCGAPEYGCGSSFDDFLSIMSKDSSLSEDCLLYYQTCCNVSLDHQVGSRYFVSAANGVRVIFLRRAAIEFLQYTGKDNGNKLERDVLEKLLDRKLFFLLEADALMYYHIYADLVMLSESNDLKKSVLDMNRHYLELQLFLEEVEKYPEIVMDCQYAVFQSEDRLYGDNKKINHRLHKKSEVLYERLFKESASDSDALFPLLSSGAALMKEKLCAYAQNNLPGGIYWDPPEPEVRKVFAELQPSNDLCESILGLNDYLTTALPNLHQVACSNLVEVKKNKTMKWLDSLPDDHQAKVIDLAVESRQAVRREHVEAEKEVAKRRQEHLINSHLHHEAMKRKAKLERDQPSQLHLVTTSRELHEILSDIESKSATATQKKVEKRSFLSGQVKLRKKLLGQSIHISFSRSGRQRPLCKVIQELSDYIDQDPSSAEFSTYIEDPGSLVGKHISHKFELEDTNDIKWYNGMVVDYDTYTKAHELLMKRKNPVSLI